MEPGKEYATLAVPESCANAIITLYHERLFSDMKALQNITHYFRQILHSQFDT